MSNFVSLDDAAKKLGVSVEELVEMRSSGEIHGYRDGASWKFKPEEIDRVAGEMQGDALDDGPSGSSLLGADLDSDVSLVAEPGEGSDVRLVAKDSAPQTNPDDDIKLADSDDDDDELALAPADDDILSGDSDKGSAGGSELELLGSDLELAGSGSDAGSEVSLGSDLELSVDDVSGVMSGSDINLDTSGSNQSDLIKGDSDPAVKASGLGSDLELADDDDLVLGSGSDLALGNDSGINLMSPADSGISLEDEPLDLAASGISGLDLAVEGSDVENPSAGGSAVDFQQDEEFQLSPSGAIEADDDSGSQVIELEDSSDFGDGAVALPSEDGFDAFSDADGGGGLDQAEALGAPSGAAALPASPEIPYNTLEVLGLLGILLLLCMSGILVTDVVRNLWSWSGEGSTLTSSFTQMLLNAIGQ